MKPSKILVYILTSSILAYGCIWTFNHVNPWLAILMLFMVGYVSLLAIEKLFSE